MYKTTGKGIGRVGFGYVLLPMASEYIYWIMYYYRNINMVHTNLANDHILEIKRTN